MSGRRAAGSWLFLDSEFRRQRGRYSFPQLIDRIRPRIVAYRFTAAEDPAIHKLTVEVQNLLKPRSVYRDPALVERLLAKMAEA